MYALELAVAKYQPLNRYSSTCIQAFPVALRGLFYIIVYYTFEHIGLPFIIFITHSNMFACPSYLLFTQCILLLTLNGIVAHEAMPLRVRIMYDGSLLYACRVRSFIILLLITCMVVYVVI